MERELHYGTFIYKMIFLFIHIIYVHFICTMIYYYKEFLGYTAFVLLVILYTYMIISVYQILKIYFEVVEQIISYLKVVFFCDVIVLVFIWFGMMMLMMYNRLSKI